WTDSGEQVAGGPAVAGVQAELDGFGGCPVLDELAHQPTEERDLRPPVAAADHEGAVAPRRLEPPPPPGEVRPPGQECAGRPQPPERAEAGVAVAEERGETQQRRGPGRYVLEHPDRQPYGQLVDTPRSFDDRGQFSRP